ncbi:MAG: L,D-transpeptidase [Chitinophagaceae bacterium]|jgi:hypothetical protein
MTIRYWILAVAFLPFISCKENPTSGQEKKIESKQFKKEAEKPAEEIVPQKPLINYHFEKKSIWKLADSFEGNQHKNIIAAINRVDEKHLQRLDSILVPDKYIDTIAYYMPFPLYADALKDIDKIILFSYPAQAFAAYENGKLIISGPTNMGKKASKTPTGLFFCNWKAKETRSTVDNEWILKWNFNISNMGGVGFHQYDLPGYPASHSCLRLWADQAEFLYSWANQWKLNKSGQLLAKGTPVIVFGAYPFGSPRPWFVLAGDGKALDISKEQLSEIVTPFKEQILKEQQVRQEVIGQVADTNKTVAKI